MQVVEEPTKALAMDDAKLLVDSKQRVAARGERAPAPLAFSHHFFTLTPWR